MADLAENLAKKVPKPSGSKKKEEPDDEAMSLDQVEDDAADEMIAAIEEGDRAGFKAGLRDFVKACIARQEKGEY